jgi:hypothetical protein
VESHLGTSLHFFLYDVPKVMTLLPVNRLAYTAFDLGLALLAASSVVLVAKVMQSDT